MPGANASPVNRLIGGYPGRARSGGGERYALYRHQTHPWPRERGRNLPAVVSATPGAGIV
jgi:hypothetical protein